MAQHTGGRLPANFRRANTAEGLATQMLRPFAAIAAVPREEDIGIDVIGTLLRRVGRVYVGEDSFFVQIKTSTSANFTMEGDGIQWLRELDLPYFPVVMDLDTEKLSLYTINHQRHGLIAGLLLSKINFTPEGDCPDDFPLVEPLMTWNLAEISHPDFPGWAYSVLKPAIRVEAWNQRFWPTRSIRYLDYETQMFSERRADGKARQVPAPGRLLHLPPGDGVFIEKTLTEILEPFAAWISNTGKHDHLGEELLTIRGSLRKLGLDPDPNGNWDEIAADMKEYSEGTRRGKD